MFPAVTRFTLKRAVSQLACPLQAHPTVTQLRAQDDQVQHGTAEPIQQGHHQHIPVPQDPQHQVQLRREASAPLP